MKVAFVSLFKNDADILKITVPRIPKDLFDNFIYLDTGSSDGSRQVILNSIPNAIFINDRIIEWNWGRWYTMLMDEARKRGYEWMFMIDSDEIMFHKEYEQAFKYLEIGESNLYRFARINTCGKQKWIQKFYPDWQARLIKLDAGFYYDDKLHAQPKLNNKIVEGNFLADVRIFHYGWICTPEKNALKHLNYKLMGEGKPVLDKYPKDLPVAPMDFSRMSQTYLGEQPL